jgi:hypothetical protein
VERATSRLAADLGSVSDAGRSRTVPRTPAAGVRKPPGEETAIWESLAVPRTSAYGDLAAGPRGREYNFSVLARTLLMVENDFRILCIFKELRVAKIAHISTSALCA